MLGDQSIHESFDTNNQYLRLALGVTVTLLYEEFLNARKYK